MTNALAGERSPFLQHGATQPVAWQPWGADAFERARAEDRPILLDIGAVWCHWCHVMDRESYEDEATAALINELFVPIKVDRDERPDVDARYQRAVQLLTGQGGWPLTAFLTPDGDVFYGGTYFPPQPAHGRPSFTQVLREVARVWRDDRARALDAAAQIGERLTAAAGAETRAGEPAPSLITDALEELAQSFDFRYGGFGRAPKFPNAAALDLLQDEYLDNGTDWARRIVEETLTAMIEGGFHDQIGGGFHRYSTDARWIIPHFEKMAYDNGVLLATCARAHAAFGGEEYAAAAAGVVAHYRDIAPDLLAAGGFPASQDADHSPADDGDYWTWTAEEIGAALQDDGLARIARVHFGVDDPASGMHLDPDRHVLYRAVPVAQLAERFDMSRSDVADALARIRAALGRARDQRPSPYVDRTVYTGWTALVASGFLSAERHAGVAGAAADALRALDRIMTSFDAGRGIPHRLDDDRVDAHVADAHVEDHAHVLLALLDAFEHTQDEAWLRHATAVADVLRTRFRDPDAGALRDRPLDAAAIVPQLDRPLLPIADAPAPSGNGAAALGLLRLHAYTGDEQARDGAGDILRAFAGSAGRLGSAAATWLKAVAWHVRPVAHIVVIEEPGGPLFAAALRAALPRTVIRRFSPGATPEVAALPRELAAMLSSAAPRAYVCVGSRCAPPADDASGLIERLRSLRG